MGSGVYLQRRRGRLVPGLGEQVKSMCTCTKLQLPTPPSPLPPALRAPCCLLLEPREGRPRARAPVVPLAVLLPALLPKRRRFCFRFLRRPLG